MSMKNAFRQALWNVTGGRCFYCHAELAEDDGDVTGKSRMERDHKTPRARGGDDSLENSAPACGRCNSQKKDRTIAEYREFLLRMGVIPHFFGDDRRARDWLLLASQSAANPDKRAREHAARCQKMPPWPQVGASA